jgi:hypothetical protein
MTRKLPPDERDDELASLLEVPPLDDDTRRRLVTRALDDARPASAPRRLRRVLVPAAAVLVAVVLVGVGVIALVDRGGEDTTTAGRSSTTEAPSPDRRAPAPDQPSGAESLAVAKDLGDLGDVTDAGDLRREVRARLDEPPAAARAAAPACLERAVAGSPPPSAFGTGTRGGEPVLVLLLPSTGDRSSIVLLATETCRAVSVLDLS